MLGLSKPAFLKTECFKQESQSKEQKIFIYKCLQERSCLLKCCLLILLFGNILGGGGGIPVTCIACCSQKEFSNDPKINQTKSQLIGIKKFKSGHSTDIYGHSKAAVV